VFGCCWLLCSAVGVLRGSPDKGMRAYYILQVSVPGGVNGEWELVNGLLPCHLSSCYLSHIPGVPPPASVVWMYGAWKERFGSNWSSGEGGVACSAVAGLSGPADVALRGLPPVASSLHTSARPFRRRAAAPPAHANPRLRIRSGYLRIFPDITSAVEAQLVTICNQLNW
jgi:hypothetical protein